MDKVLSLNNFAIRAVTLAAGQWDEMQSLFEPIKRRESLDHVDHSSPLESKN